MFSFSFALIVVVAVFLVLIQNGKWRQRARMAEKQNKENRKAHDIQNNVTLDPDYRERMRRHFDQP